MGMQHSLAKIQGDDCLDDILTLKTGNEIKFTNLGPLKHCLGLFLLFMRSIQVASNAMHCLLSLEGNMEHGYLLL